MVAKFVREESGATMIEYGLIGALISVAAIAILILMGGGIEGVFNASTDAIADAIS